MENDLMDNNHYMWTVKSIDINGADNFIGYCLFLH